MFECESLVHPEVEGQPAPVYCAVPRCFVDERMIGIRLDWSDTRPSTYEKVAPRASRPDRPIVLTVGPTDRSRASDLLP